MFTKAELERKKRPDTAATQFKNSLAQLIEILMKEDPSYIRCIKPNEAKLPSRFNRAIVAHQVCYLIHSKSQLIQSLHSSGEIFGANGKSARTSSWLRIQATIRGIYQPV